MSQPVDVKEWRLVAQTDLWTGDVDGKGERVVPTGLLGSIRWWCEVLVPVGLVGYLVVHEGSEIHEPLEEVEELFIGGDTRYGLGRVRRVAWEPASHVFGIVPDLDGAGLCLTTERVLAHASVPEGAATLSGDLEALAWWDDGQLRTAPGAQPYRRPGSASATPVRWEIEESGLWAMHVAGERAEIAAEGVG